MLIIFSHHFHLSLYFSWLLIVTKDWAHAFCITILLLFANCFICEWFRAPKKITTNWTNFLWHRFKDVSTFNYIHSCNLFLLKCESVKWEFVCRFGVQTGKYKRKNNNNNRNKQGKWIKCSSEHIMTKNEFGKCTISVYNECGNGPLAL